MVALVNRDLEIILNLIYKLESPLSLSSLESDVLVVARVEMSFVTQVFNHQGACFIGGFVSLLLLFNHMNLFFYQINS